MPINSFLYPGAKVTTGYDVANSLRFNDGSSDYLTRTNSGTGSTSKSTISLWTKRSGISSYQDIWESFNDNSNYFRLRFRDDNRLDMQSDISNSTVFLKRTTRVFRDPSAWYHICVAIDLTQSNADKIKLYINGTRETAFDSSTDLTSTSQQFVGGGGSYNFTIGRHPSSDAYYDGYMAEYVFVDGQALDPTSFGEFDEDSGIWKPIDVSGLTFGTNGFYLDFEDSSALGNDVSGNDNDFTVNNLTAIDQSTDTCTNNFATLNPLISIGSDSGNAQVLSQGNLTVAGNQASWCHSRGTFGASSGKWYWEAKLTGTMGNVNIGVSNAGTNMFGGTVQSLSGNTSIYGDGQYNINGSITGSQSPTFSSGDICGVALNMDDNTVSFYKNGTILSWGTNLAISGGTDDVWLPASAVYKSDGASSPVIEFNFGSPPYTISSGNTDGNGYGNFEYAVPSGYYALNTKNLAEYG